jgi:hypothetical protein
MTSAPKSLAAKEMEKADFGDHRLTVRAVKLVDDLMVDPSKSLPELYAQDRAGLDGAYRFLNNEATDLQNTVRPHVVRSFARVRQHSGGYCSHDSCAFSFTGELLRFGLGRITSPGSQGFFAHYSVGFSRTGLPLGTLGVSVFVRPQELKKKLSVYDSKRDPLRESTRWEALADEVNRQDPRRLLIHVMDRESDIYELLCFLVSRGIRFILRVAQDRALAGTQEHLFEKMEQLAVKLTRTAPLSNRGETGSPNEKKIHPPRQARVAKLKARAGRLTLKRPQSTEARYPETLTLNYVDVQEEDAPESEEPIHWRLVTSEPVSTKEEVAAVIDGYRMRWGIEEFNKGLKTGCRIEASQNGNFEALTTKLGLLLPVVWQLMTLRFLSRGEEARASEVLTPVQIEVLRALLRKPLPPRPSAQEALLGIAALGGHLKHNGPPGWLILLRGAAILQKAVAVWELAQARLQARLDTQGPLPDL